MKTYADEPMDYKKLTAKYKQLVQEPLKVLSVRGVNHKPHPFMLGPKHIVEDQMYVQIKAAPCAMQGCHKMASEHSFDVVLAVQLTRNAKLHEVHKILLALKELLEQDGIDGVSFIETPEKFRVLPNEI